MGGMVQMIEPPVIELKCCGYRMRRYKKTIEIDPRFPRAYEGLGNMYAAIFGRMKEAVLLFEKARRLAPETPAYPMLLSHLYLDLGDDPQFQAIAAEVEADMALQLAALRKDIADLDTWVPSD